MSALNSLPWLPPCSSIQSSSCAAFVRARGREFEGRQVRELKGLCALMGQIGRLSAGEDRVSPQQPFRLANSLNRKGRLCSVWNCTCTFQAGSGFHCFPGADSGCRLTEGDYEEVSDSIFDRHGDGDYRSCRQLKDLAGTASPDLGPAGTGHCPIRAWHTGELQRTAWPGGLPGQRCCESWRQDPGTVATDQWHRCS